jgi:hypothetical protein
VPNASDDFPEPETPVNATMAFRGMSTSTLRRLCSLAPRTCTKPSVASIVTGFSYPVPARRCCRSRSGSVKRVASAVGEDAVVVRLVYEQLVGAGQR